MVRPDRASNMSPQCIPGRCVSIRRVTRVGTSESGAPMRIIFSASIARRSGWLFDRNLLTNWKDGKHRRVSSTRTIANKVLIETIEAVVDYRCIAGLRDQPDVSVLNIVGPI